MPKLHELLAAEKVPAKTWNDLQEDTRHKFKRPDDFFRGHDVSLKMIEAGPEAEAEEAAARQSKAVPTTVHDTLDFALDQWVKYEDLQYQKNATNRTATGTVMWDGKELLKDLPVDELLGLEARLAKIRALIEAAPTLDATKHWKRNEQMGRHVWGLEYPEQATKTKKLPRAFVKHEGTDKHPPQVDVMTEDKAVGTFTKQLWSGACTAVQKSDALLRIDALILAVKQARMRANETEAVTTRIAGTLKELIMEPFKK